MPKPPQTSSPRHGSDAAAIRGLPLAPDVPGADLVPGLVQRIAATRLLGSPQLTRFLEFIVAESLAGRGEALKAFTIATASLGRPVDFDPARDPIVRVEATRLRSALSAYFGEEGRDEPIRLRLARGSYQPLVEVVASARAGTAPLRAFDGTTASAPVCEVAALRPYRWRALIAVSSLLVLIVGLLAFNAAMMMHLNDHLDGLNAAAAAQRPPL